MRKEFFEVKLEHIKLLKKMYVRWWDAHFGAPGIDPKRPYGNSDVYVDMAKILNVKGFKTVDEEWVFSIDEVDYMDALHREMETVLQIFIDTFLFLPGFYEKEMYIGDWKKV